jgi:DNA-binding NarL/FixJ family response regulator
VQPIRILLGEMPRMMREIVEPAVATQADMQVVGAVSARETLASEVGRTRAEVVIVGLDSAPQVPSYEAVLYAHPHLKMLAVVDSGREALLYELRPHTVPLGQVSVAGLLDAIRAAHHHEA